MLFNSYGFIFLFLPVAFTGFFIIARRDRKYAALWLAACSLFFYGWWNPKFVLLLVASVVANYCIGRTLARAPGSAPARRLLVAALAANLLVLGVFKYANFFFSTVEEIAGAPFLPLDIVLPLGISFFTFTQIAFLVDAYRGLAREYSFIHYLLFVSYFPHLVAGPIIHHKEIMPQFEAAETYRVRLDFVAVGLTLFTLGLAKKVLLADTYGEWASPVFDLARDGEKPQFFVAWAGALAYTLQLYFDFSGYSDMAVGLSLLFGVRLPFNFDSPYKARNIIEFWRRWHMTLSRFLRDYLYFPLGGNRKGPARRYANLMATMLLGGLWHGASWTFVAWGGLHGLFLVVNHGWQRLALRLGWSPMAPSRFRSALAIGITFACVVCGWVLFRAEDFGSARALLAGMAGLNGISLPRTIPGLLGVAPHSAASLGVVFEGIFHGAEVSLAAWNPLPAVAFIAAGLLIVWGLPNSQQFVGLQGEGRWRPSPAFGVAIGVLFAFAVASLSKISTFLYYQF